jgi:hypothetical protein
VYHQPDSGLRGNKTPARAMSALRQGWWLEMRMTGESGELFGRYVQYLLRDHA